MQPDYTDQLLCLARVRERTGLVDDLLINELLLVTSGHTAESPDVKVYRPYWVSAELLDQKRREIQQAEGATFRDIQKNIDALRRMQWSIDAQYGIIAPVGTTITTFASKGSNIRKSTNGRVNYVNALLE